MKRLALISTALLVVLDGAVSSAGTAGGDVPGRFVDVWVRGERSEQDNVASRTRSRRFDLDQGAMKQVERYDAQYDRVAHYRGVPLRALLERFASDESLDLAILHFANGMAIPFAFRDHTAALRLDPFVARGYKPSRNGRFTSVFPAIRREGDVPDPRPTQFSGNKVVVSDRWHPALARTTEATFSPWARADTLVGVELVADGRYYAQFDVGSDPPIRRGFELYRASCQFCHGARHVGASFGWDFVDSPNVYDVQASAADLYHHIAYRPRNATELGLLMPALASLTEEDASYLRRWLQAISTRPMPAYVPPAQSEPRRGKK
jgi:mono/diheme cytochrome c family protein